MTEHVPARVVALRAEITFARGMFERLKAELPACDESARILASWIMRISYLERSLRNAETRTQTPSVTLDHDFGWEPVT